MKLNAHQSEHLLRSFFDRLELAGISVSPADYVRIGQMLSQVDEVEDISRLKYLISPILAGSAADQKIIHQVFDDYVISLNDWMSNDLAERAKGRKVLTKYPKWITYLSFPFLFSALFCLVLLIYLSPDEEVWTQIDQQKEWRLGDSLRIQYQQEESKAEDEELFFEWRIEGQNGESLLEKKTSDPILNLSLTNEILSDSVRLNFSVFRGTDPVLVFSELSQPIPVLCAETPSLLRIRREGNLERTTLVHFYPDLAGDSTGVQFYWTLSGNEFREDTGALFSHTFMKKGSYNLMVKAVRGGESFFCESTFSENIELEVGFPDIAKCELLRTEGDLKAFFSRGIWIVWAVLFFLTVLLLFLYRRRKRYRDKEWEENQKELEDVASVEFSDTPPYSIEFRSEEKRIRGFDQRFLLSKAMHKRNEKPGFELDLSASITETLDNGGFPSVRFKTESKANQFLFLIHQEHRHSHDARLFEHLAHLMEEDEVLMLTMFYRENPSIPHNDDYPGGIGINQLKSQYGEFRVLLFTEGDELINDHYAGRRGMKPGWFELDDVFADLTIISPVSVDNWGYTESRLYEFTDIFPADIKSLMLLSSYLENYDESNPRPLFRDWKKQFLANKDKSLTNFDHFRKPEKYREVLGSEAMYEWFLALSVYSKPNWDLTLSIGRTLENTGFSLSFDNILLLSRIPALHEGEFHPALLSRMRIALGERPALEEKARRVLKQKLEELNFIQANSFAADEYEVLVAKNDFILDPEDHQNKHNILLLMKAKRFNKLDALELIRHSVNKDLKKASGKQFRKDVDSLEYFLEFGEEEERNEMRKRYNLVGFSLSAWLMLLLYCLYQMLSYDNTRALEQYTLEHESFSFMSFTKEEYSAAERKNNQAVDLFWGQDRETYNPEHFGQIDSLLQEAVDLDPEHELIKQNIIRNIHNGFVDRFLYIAQRDDWGTATADSLGMDIDYFYTHLPSLEMSLDAGEDMCHGSDLDGSGKFLLHFKGLLKYYQGDRVSAYAYRDSIMHLDSAYFLNLDFSPHLLDLLPAERISQQFILKGKVLDAKGDGYGRVIIQIGADEAICNSDGEYELLVNNPDFKEQLMVEFRLGNNYETPFASSTLDVGMSTEQYKDFTLSSRNTVYDNQPLGKEVRLEIRVTDERGNTLNGVSLTYGGKTYEINGRRELTFRQTSRPSRVKLSKKGYITKESSLNVFNKKRRRQTIEMKRDDVSFEFQGVVNDYMGQGLSGYTVEFGSCTVKTRGKDGRFDLNCTIKASEDIPTRLIIRDREGMIVDTIYVTDSSKGILSRIGDKKKK